MAKSLIPVVYFALMAAAISGAAARTPEVRTGLASWYGSYEEGRLTASGCRFRRAGLTAASRTLPLGTWVEVRNEENGRTVIVLINDRGPFIRGRSIDLSLAAAAALGMVRQGVALVSVRILMTAPVHCGRKHRPPAIMD